ncbi:SDR family NAD(P)-dependent oxidoreductase [Burkholderia stagnalis]
MTRTDAETHNAYIVTGPTSGIGYRTALALARHGTVVLVGRSEAKLADVRRTIERRGQRAVPVMCDLSDIESIRRAAKEIVALGLPIAGLLHNAGVMQMRATTNEAGWDATFATNHLGPFALTEALAPSLPDGTNVVFVVSAVEDPGRKPAVAAGFRGGRYLSAEASARGEWKAGGAKRPGFDAYATSKQAILAAAMAFAREMPRLRFNAVEPGLNPTTGLGLGDVGPVMRALLKFMVPLLVPLLRPFVKVLSTPKQSARIISGVVLDTSGRTGVYYDERGRPMHGSALVSDPAFQDRVVAETRALLSSLPTHA